MADDPAHFGTGWRPDPPSDHDHSIDHDDVVGMLEPTGMHGRRDETPPESVDLERFAGPVFFQGYYNTCTSHVVAAMLAMLETVAHGKHVPASRLFLYQVTKRFLGESGDPGVYLRQTFGTVSLLGVPPETYFPYLDTAVKDDPRLAAEPDAFCYAVARDFGALTYFRFDPPKADPKDVLRDIKLALAHRVPASLGFPLYVDALKAAKKNGGALPRPAPGASPAGSHAILLAGYDDTKKIDGSSFGGPITTGAFKIQNSWGEDWGAKGFGWLPYEYLLQGEARDCWTMMGPKWVDTSQFSLGW